MLRLLYKKTRLHMKLFLREKASVFWSYAFPVFLILLFGAVFGGQDSSPLSMRVLVADQDQSIYSGILVDSALAQIPAFRIERGNSDSLRERLQNGKGTLLLEIPSGFGHDLQAGNAQVNVYYNEANIQYNSAAQAILEVIEYQFAKRMSGMQAPLQFTAKPLRDTRVRLNYVDYFLPGLIGISLMSTCLFSIGFVLTSYREKGNLRRLQVTPLPKVVFVLAIIIQRYFIILSQAVLLIVIAILIFGAHLSWDMLLDGWLFLSLGIFTFVALGFLIGARIAKAETGAGIANVIFFPMMFLSGTFFPVDNLPGFMQPLLKVLPLKYVVEGLRKISIDGASIFSLGTEIIVLAGCGIFFFAVAVKIFRWQ